MCLTCGCGNNDDVRVLTLDAHDHSHHDHHRDDHEHHTPRIMITSTTMSITTRASRP